jgi:hypothetical protein
MDGGREGMEEWMDGRNGRIERGGYISGVRRRGMLRTNGGREESEQIFGCS